MRRHQGLRLRAAKLAAAAAALKRQSGLADDLSPPFSLAFMTDARRAPNPMLIARVLPAGSAVILRDYRAPPRRAGLAAQLKSVCAARGVKLLIGADIDLAVKLGADGVHLPRWFMPAAPLPKGLIVSASAHNAAELTRAHRLGAGFAFVSPVFATGSHADAAGLGADAFKRLAATAPLPVLALGGVDETNAQHLAGRNVAGLAAIGAFLD